MTFRQAVTDRRVVSLSCSFVIGIILGWLTQSIIMVPLFCMAFAYILFWDAPSNGARTSSSSQDDEDPTSWLAENRRRDITQSIASGTGPYGDLYHYSRHNRGAGCDDD